MAELNQKWWFSATRSHFAPNPRSPAPRSPETHYLLRSHWCGRSRDGCYVVSFLFLTMQLAFSADDRQKNYEAARQHASEIADNFNAGSFQVRSTFQIHVLGGQLNGTYQYSQLSREEYREEIETTDFSESVVSRGGELYFSRTKELEPLPILYLRELIYFARIMPVFAPISTTTTSVLERTKR